MPTGAIERHRELVARVKAQQAKTRARLQSRPDPSTATKAHREAPPRTTPPPVADFIEQPTPKRAIKRAERSNPGARKERVPSVKPRGTKTTVGGTMPGRNGGGYRYTGTGEVVDAMGRVVVDVARTAGEEYVRGKMGASSTSTEGSTVKDYEPRYYYGGRRRRRRRLLTSSDKSDIAFIIGQLGTGQVGRAAISALLSRRV